MKELSVPVVLSYLMIGAVALVGTGWMEIPSETPLEQTATDWRFADFVSQTLNGSDFRSVDLSMSDFRHATLREVNFTNADLTWANFVGAQMCGVIMPDESLCDFNCDETDDLISPVRTHCPYLAP